jgi:uncharacterized protein (TIGR02118 family)
MHKLVILFETPPDWLAFEAGWQTFMGLVEKMPGLRAETVSEVQTRPFDPLGRAYVKIHELLFADRPALDAAMRSPAGQEAGHWLHTFTGGRFVLLTARHMEAASKDFTKPSQSS